MPVTMKDLGLDKLSLGDRTRLAHELWERVEDEVKTSRLTDAQRADLERRLADYYENPAAGSTWEEVEARLLGKKSCAADS